jgi:hypothetical protein
MCLTNDIYNLIDKLFNLHIVLSALLLWLLWCLAGNCPINCRVDFQQICGDWNVIYSSENSVFEILYSNRLHSTSLLNRPHIWVHYYTALTKKRNVYMPYSVVKFDISKSNDNMKITSLLNTVLLNFTNSLIVSMFKWKLVLLDFALVIIFN